MMRYLTLVGALSLLAAATALSLPAEAKTPDVAFDKAWLDGLQAPGTCEVLPPNADHVARLPAAERQRRVAFVVGNGGYKLPDWRLPNPPRDAVGVARLLQSVGFEVYLLGDGTAEGTVACAAKAAAKPADLAVVYYSGHGLQREYTNYLVATDIAGLDKSLAGLVSLDQIVRGMRSSSTTVLVFLDACRNNPAASAGGGPAGLAPEQVVPRAAKMTAGGEASTQRAPAATGADALSGGELFVAFSTSPNSVASDGTVEFSPFTQAFLKYATTPGWSIQRVLAEVTKSVGETTDWGQTPWTRSSLTSQVFLNGGVDPAEALRASQLKAKQSRERLALGDRKGAVREALQALPEKLSDGDAAKYADAYEALYRAVRSRSLQLPITGAVHPAFSHDGRRVATVSAELGSGARKEALKLWDVEKGTLVAELLPLQRSGTASMTLLPAAFSADSRFLAHIDVGTGQPVVWDAGSGTKLAELPKIPGISLPMITVPRIALSGTGKYVLIWNTGSAVHVYHVAEKRILSTIKSGAGTMAAAISPDETAIVTAAAAGSSGGGEYKTIRIEGLDLATKKKLWAKDIPEASWGAYGAYFSTDGRKLGVTTSSDAVVVLDVGSGAAKRIPVPRVGTSGLSFSPDGDLIAVVSEDTSNSQPAFRSTATGEEVKLAYEKGAILDTVHSPAGEEVGTPWFPDAGDIWRKGPMGAALIEAAIAALPSNEMSEVAKGRVRFR